MNDSAWIANIDTSSHFEGSKANKWAIIAIGIVFALVILFYVMVVI